MPIRMNVRCGQGRGLVMTFTVTKPDGSALNVTRAIYGLRGSRVALKDSETNGTGVTIENNVVTVEIFPEDTIDQVPGLYEHDCAVEIDDDATDRRDVMDGKFQIVERVAQF
jgi:hypothetical protein